MIHLGIDAPPGSRTAQVVQLLESDVEIQTLWYMANRTSKRAAVNDHGPVHVRTCMHFGQRLLRLLIDAGVQPTCVTDHGMSEDDATVVVSEVLHAVLAHNVNERCLTIEAGIVKVADALDMTKGRSRKAIASGKIDIHSISAAAVEAVRITPGTNRPVRVEVDINNPAAVFHLKEVFGQKLARSSIVQYVEVPKLDELLDSLRELSTSEDTQRDAEVAATNGRTTSLDERRAGEPLGIGRGRVPTTIA